MLATGIEVRVNMALGRDVTYESLMGEGFEAIFMATGTPRGLWARVEGENLQGVRTGIDFLRDLNLGKEMKPGPRVVVIGGGQCGD